MLQILEDGRNNEALVDHSNDGECGTRCSRKDVAIVTRLDIW